MKQYSKWLQPTEGTKLEHYNCSQRSRSSWPIYTTHRTEYSPVLWSYWVQNNRKGLLLRFKSNSHFSWRAGFHPHCQGEGTHHSKFLWGGRDQTSRLVQLKKHTTGFTRNPLRTGPARLFCPSSRTSVITILSNTVTPVKQFKCQ